MATGSIFTAILAGIVIGALGRLIVPGKQAIGWILTFALGLVGAFVGGFLAEGLDIDVWWQTLIVQVVVAAILVLLVASLIRSRSSGRRSPSD
ncbi:MAG TPA: GlsB/YeaQ/YmgE family stress response membrane protein [Nocardioidaceae bacterium]|nr:GlsB/YeaQ/YmgE family stress response membrane protein [Nocardioidaceae bacterium]